MHGKYSTIQKFSTPPKQNLHHLKKKFAIDFILFFRHIYYLICLFLGF